MAKKPDKRKPDDPEQSRRFEETARDVEAVDNENALAQALALISENFERNEPSS